jgi:transposase
MITYWDKEQKKYRKKSIYLGKITNPETKEYKAKGASAKECTNELILNFGDTYSIAKTLENSEFHGCIKNILPNDFDTLFSLICFKLLKSSSMQYAQTWANGNYVSQMCRSAELSSQRISEFLKKLGKESVWRRFFKSYIEKLVGDKTGVIVDSTGLPNEIDFPLSAWGNHGGESERETRLLMVVDRNSGNPLYFSYKAGNIVDVSTLSNTIAELLQMGVSTSFALIDAGYFSEDNIKELFAQKISFLTRLPAGRVLYKSLITEHSSTLEDVKNLVVYGKRALYVRRVSVDLFGNRAFAYIICDIKRKGNEITNFLIAAKEDKLSDEEINEKLLSKGKLVIISSDNIPSNEILPLYYTRQSAENLFGITKSFLDILPIRTHSIETFRGYLMLNFIALIGYIEINKRLKGEFTVEGALLEMTNLMCKIYNNETIICEPTKKMKRIAELLSYTVPKTSGV